MENISRQERSIPLTSQFWGICCESGKKYTQIVQDKFHISMAVLDATVETSSDVVSLMVERNSSQYLLCSFKKGEVYQTPLDLFFEKGEKITFFLKGHGMVHLSGYEIYDSSSAAKLTKGSSAEKAAKTQVANFDVDDSEEEDSMDDDSEEDSDNEKNVSPVKKLFNSLNKKMTKDVKAFPKVVKKASDDEDSSDLDSSDEDEELESGQDAKTLMKQALKRPHDEDSEDEDESLSEDSSDEESDMDDKGTFNKKSDKGFLGKKKLNAKISTPSKNSTPGPKASNKVTEVVDLDNEFGTVGKGAKKSGGDMNSSIGRTPMPKKLKTALNQSNSSNKGSEVKVKKAKGESPVSSFNTESGKSPKKSADVTVAFGAKKSVDLTVAVQTPNQSASGKKKKNRKRKSKGGLNDSAALEKTPDKPNQGSPKAKNKTLPAGLESSDVRVGSGPEAKRGKMVHVYYTGRLENGKVFDSCQNGSKPFSFKLGAGDVIQGWDLGLEGMKVGGKRNLKIPPKMAYQNQKMGDIPPNSTLNFTVELRAVS